MYTNELDEAVADFACTYQYQVVPLLHEAVYGNIFDMLEFYHYTCVA